MQFGVSETVQKKWFILYENGYQGPFNSEQIDYLYKAKQIGKKNLIWAEHLSNWAEIENIKEFSSAEKIVGRPEYKTEIDVVTRTQISAFQTEYSLEDYNFINELTTQPSETVLSANPSVVTKNKNSKIYYLFFILGASLFTAFGFFYKNRPIEIQNFSALSAQENQEFRKTALSRFNKGIEQIQLLVKSTSAKQTFLFVSTNMPDETELNFTLQGLPETLLSTATPILELKGISQRHSLQIVLRAKDGNELPMGFYEIVAKNKTQSLLNAKVFIGDMTPEQYKKSLNAYHQKLNAHAKEEIAELKQVLSTAESQKMALGRKMTARRYKDWLNLQSQIVTIIDYWDLSDKTELYYSSLFKQIKILHTKISKYAVDVKAAMAYQSSSNSEALLEASESINLEILRLKSNLDYLDNLIATN